MGVYTRIVIFFLIIVPCVLSAQEIELFQQFNGRYDYLSFGNTMNTGENTGQEPPTPCEILTESSADYALPLGQTIIAAYLYWAGSSPIGDYDIQFNGTPITAERTFSLTQNGGLVYFAASTDITSYLQNNGNGTYTLSEFDISSDIDAYCGNTTNFGGWAVTVIYEDPSLPLNQVNIFDGLESVSGANPLLTIELDNLNVLDNTGAKIGFLAWEGDASLAVMETLKVNGNVISNPPLNPADNQFNSTNSFTGSDLLFNMDIDFYNIENNIQPGDTSATIELTSGQDFVMINNVVTVLNTELPDATIEIVELIGGIECGNRELEVSYTVYNVDSTAELPANVPIAFYANTTLVGQAATTAVIPIDGSETGIITLSIPSSILADFELKAVVDDNGSGNGTVAELHEDNNEFVLDVHLLVFPEVGTLNDLELCDVVGTEIFDLTQATTQINPVYDISYHETEDDANSNSNPIPNPEAYQNIVNPQTIYVRVANPDCYVVVQFTVEVIPCPLPDATIEIEDDLNACRQRDLVVPYTVYNIKCTGPLPAHTPIAFYVEGVFTGQSQTQNNIPIDGSEPGVIVLSIPENTPDLFLITAVVDDIGNGIGVVEELNEGNNEFDIDVEFGSIPPIGDLPDLLVCDEGFNTGTFDLTQQNEYISNNPNDEIIYYTTYENAVAKENPISDPGAYVNGADPQLIFVRLENEICFTIGEFLLTTENCPPWIPDGFSPNGDGINDVFEITGLLHVFEDFELQIFSREGNRIFTGRNENGFWDGIATEGLLFTGSLVPVGTYYYVLQLNDPKFSKPYLGFIYINY
jgi:gliding motility-associated-like protein